MKIFKSIAVILLSGVLFNVTTSCGSDPAPSASAQDQQVTKLSKAWTVASASSVTRGGQPPVEDYSAFKLTITGTAGSSTLNYTTSGRPPGTKSSVWAASGTLVFGSDFATLLTREDGTSITYAVSDSQLQLSFTYGGTGYDARTSVVTGAWVFTMKTP